MLEYKLMWFSTIAPQQILLVTLKYYINEGHIVFKVVF